MEDQPYLSTKDLAHRYGICIATVKRWRTSTRRGTPLGPTWYEVPRLATERKLNTPYVRYALPQVLAWEEANSVTPINSF